MKSCYLQKKIARSSLPVTTKRALNPVKRIFLKPKPQKLPTRVVRIDLDCADQLFKGVTAITHRTVGDTTFHPSIAAGPSSDYHDVNSIGVGADLPTQFGVPRRVNVHDDPELARKIIEVLKLITQKLDEESTVNDGVSEHFVSDSQ
eukprot:sb/3473760/